ncbi:MAG TPA: 16S rRNA (cytidine(1402)-2'-O)-methyltransferase [bacterium]|nr:16S rRNA (cytidine(1402)-2'-O)-methyltransferase [bacterium]HPS30145.1 16S rRNA (cytidine(1402)-2'-O)-methyltransferase [bacterium]
MSGNLFVVATPIGNMSDISQRAIQVLGSCDYILAEDSRVSGGLLAKLGINTRIFSYHKFTEKKFLQKHIDELKNGRNIALVSDAGTPGVSDPGKHIVKAALEEKIPVIPVPGACAAAVSFSCSGSSSDSFVFAGFLPSKGAVRDETLKRFLSFGLPVIFYEAPTRIKDLIEKLRSAGCRIVVMRELTKHFEEIFEYDDRDLKEKGEFTVVAEPVKVENTGIEIDKQLIEIIKLSGLSTKDSAQLLSRIYPDTGKNEIKKLFIPDRKS